ncbi:heterokaryon incompatibility protein-domain-containing protein [Hyaloscypha sp. PMI_1271]|nr:heterokaryon incompatibility protein-domain-containing protein [Hyaloscypha sp. PMI_1271]
MPPPSLANGHVSKESSHNDAGLRSDSVAYKELQHNEIRIAEIDPVTADSRSEQVSGRLIHVPREKPPAYQALSYAWGRPSEREKGYILLDGIKHQVTSTLEAALHRLRHEDGQKKLLIWVEALCINQNDLIEKAREVERMRPIYQRAEQVSVWLGEHSENSPLAWKLLKELHVASNLTTVIQSHRLRAFDALKDLFRREYWWRIWVVQEVNSNENAVVYCGEDHMSWTDLLQASGRIEKATRIILDTVYHDQPHSIYTLISGGPRNLRIQRHSNTRGDEKKLPPLVDLLYSHESKLSSEDVDKVYALVGLSLDQEAFGAIDYSLPARLVFIHTAKYIIAQKECLNVICRHNNDDNPLSLPSWVPDWQRRLPFPHHRVMHMQIREPSYEAAGTTKAKFSWPPWTNNLEVFKLQASQSVPSRTLRTLSIAPSMNEIFDRRSTIDDCEAFQRTFCGGTWAPRYEDFGRGDPSQRVSQFVRLLWKMFPRLVDGMPPMPTMPLEEGIDDVELEKRAKGTVAAAALRMHGKRLVVTESKLVGFAPMAARAGDKIVVLFGCNYPVVLRQVEPKVKCLQVDGKFYRGECMSSELGTDR